MTAVMTTGPGRAPGAGADRDTDPGTVYLLHLDRPYKHARHYLGWASDLSSRLARHAEGAGANLLRVAKDAGIGWTLTRTWHGDRSRERQLKRQGGRARLCPACKHEQRAIAQPAAPETAPSRALRAAWPGTVTPAAVFQAELPGNLTAPRQARTALRHALAAWGMDGMTADAELVASELVANAAEHGGGKSIGLTLCGHTTVAGRPAITGGISDRSTALPVPRAADPDSERGRGLAIVASLAWANGVTLSRSGKTSWFTLTADPSRDRGDRQPQPELEAEA